MPGPVERNPPVSLIKFGNGSGVEESQLMKFRQRIRNIIITPDNPFDPMDRLNRTTATVPQRLRSLAPSAIQNGVGG
jgi:hypothetical protein